MKAVVLIFIVFICGSIAYDSYIGNAKSDIHPNKCFLKKENKSIEFNGIYKPFGDCVKMYCRDDYALRLIYCSKYQVPDNCVVFNTEDDLVKQYRTCCPKLKCTQQDGTVSIHETSMD